MLKVHINLFDHLNIFKLKSNYNAKVHFNQQNAAVVCCSLNSNINEWL